MSKRLLYFGALVALFTFLALGCSSQPPVEEAAPPTEEVEPPPPPPPPPPQEEEPPPPPVEITLGTVYFDFDKYNLKADAKATLTANAKLLEDNPEVTILIEGHCDERGTQEYNLALGERRAKAARTYLVDLGVQGERIRVISYGEERPADPGHTEAAWAKNRRADFVRTDR